LGRSGMRAAHLLTWLALMLGGAALLLYGYGYSRTTVLIEEERTEPAPPGPQLRPAPGRGPGLGGFNLPFLSPPPAPPRIRKVLVAATTPETRVVRDVTVGGLVRIGPGRLKRTYIGEAGPALCPT